MREFELLEHIYEHNAALDQRVVIPPGDDLAMVRLGDRDVLIGVDQLIGGRHVNLETTPLDLVGRKAITRCLSDVAAMAGKPVAALAAATLPPNFGTENADELFDAMHATASQYDCPIVGGDIAFHSDPSHPLVCSVTVLAEPGSAGVIRRDGARSGDAIYVTGELGGTIDADGGGHHLTFEPRIAIAMALAEMLGDRLHAMIDLSDGLGRDAGHIAERSAVRIRLDAAAVPCRHGVTWRQALSDGEDYELCFAAHGDVPTEIDGVAIRKVGEVAGVTDPGRQRIVAVENDREIDVSERGWQHESSDS